MSDEEEVDPILEEANRLFDQEKYQEAIALYDKLIVEIKFGAEPLFMKAECLTNLERHAEAITWYDKAIEVDDEDAMIWNGKGNAYYHLENYAQARVCFECAYEIDPETFDYYFSIIETALFMGDLDEAIRMSREALRLTENTRDKLLSWAFNIIALFLRHKPMKAIKAIDELVGFKRVLGLHGVDYDLCGVEKILRKRVSGATSRILQVLISFLKGETDVGQLSQARDKDSNAISLDDVLLVTSYHVRAPATEVYPDFNAIVDPAELDSIQQIENIVKQFDKDLGFHSFESLFEKYDWNNDRGPAPFIEEITNRFFIEIVDGRVWRLSIDLEVLAAAVSPAGQKEAQATAATYARAGTFLRFPNLEIIFITARKLDDIIGALRAASFEEGKAITLYVSVDKIPNLQGDLINLAKIDEITEIDEIPVDYQGAGKRVVGTMVWTCGGSSSPSPSAREKKVPVIAAVDQPRQLTRDDTIAGQHARGRVPIDVSDAIKVIPLGEKIVWSTFLEGKRNSRNYSGLVGLIGGAIKDKESKFVAHAIITENGVACKVTRDSEYEFREFTPTDIKTAIWPHFNKPGFICLAGLKMMELLIVRAPDYEKEADFAAKLELFPLISYPLLFKGERAALNRMDEQSLTREKEKTQKKIVKLEAEYRALAKAHSLEVVDTSKIPLGLEKLFG